MGFGLEVGGEGVEGGLGGDVGGVAGAAVEVGQGQDVDDLAAAVGAHGGGEGEDEPDRGEVIEAHGALVVVEAVVGLVEAAADGAAGIVDQDVGAAVVGEDVRGHGVQGVEIIEIAGVCGGAATGCFDFADDPVEFVGAAGDQ